MTALAGSAGAGCGDGSEGALGQAHVSADCPAEDLSCVAQGLNGPLAVGAAARLNVNVQFQGTATPPTHLLSSHPDVLLVDGDNVRGQAAGNATLLVLSDRDTVIDFMHVWVANPDRLALELYTRDGRALGEATSSLVELLPGEEMVLAAQFYGRGQRLVGAADAVWTTDSDTVTLLREPTMGRTRVVARKPGSATVTIAASALTTTFAIEVLP